MLYKFNSDSLLSSSSSDNNNDDNNDNIDNELMALSDEEMKEKDFDGFD